VFVVCKLKVKIRRNCFPQTQIPCGKIEIFLMLNPMPARLLRQTRTAPYSKKEITDVCQIHSQKKKKKKKDDPASFFFFFFFFLQIPHGSQSLCHESQQRSSRRKKPKRKKNLDIKDGTERGNKTNYSLLTPETTLFLYCSSAAAMASSYYEQSFLALY
jgi:hypothetical protein